MFQHVRRANFTAGVCLSVCREPREELSSETRDFQPLRPSSITPTPPRPYLMRASAEKCASISQIRLSSVKCNQRLKPAFCTHPTFKSPFSISKITSLRRYGIFINPPRRFKIKIQNFEHNRNGDALDGSRLRYSERTGKICP